MDNEASLKNLFFLTRQTHESYNKILPSPLPSPSPLVGEGWGEGLSRRDIFFMRLSWKCAVYLAFKIILFCFCLLFLSFSTNNLLPDKSFSQQYIIVAAVEGVGVNICTCSGLIFKFLPIKR